MTSCGGTSSVTKEAARVFQAASLGSVGFVAEINDKRERLIWLGERWLNKLTALCGPARANRGVTLGGSFAGWPALSGFWQAKASATDRLVAGQRAVRPDE